jgi:hypothetical protein
VDSARLFDFSTFASKTARFPVGKMVCPLPDQGRLSRPRPARNSFLAEARLTGQLQHPGIPPVHEPGRLDNGLPFFARKPIKGQTLAALLNLRAQAPVPA